MPLDFSRFKRIFFWEFLQNLPLLLGFVFALQSLREQAWMGMLGFSFAGSVAGSMMIRYTENNIVPGAREPISVTFTNIIVFFLIAGLVSIYFSQPWGSWQIDILLGALLGAGTGYAQDIAAGQFKPGWRHILALSLAFIPALITIRLITGYFHPLFGGIFLNLLVTLIIVCIDYLWTNSQSPS
ncbi:MAG: hypothetical protein Fur0022_42090 [Anaerolineales bacterium]